MDPEVWKSSRLLVREIWNLLDFVISNCRCVVCELQDILIIDFLPFDLL